jgi:threonylcarbamoyladenosine tRNA methylthiotransferase MtaB
LPDLLGRFGVVDVPTGISGFSGRQRAYVKVQDGCMLACSFCIIPQVRPHLASRPVEHILDEVRRLIDAGYREIVLTGIHLGHYGVEWSRDRPKREWLRLSHLVERIARLDGDFRIRLSSIEATEITRELVRVMADHPQRVCPHLHVSMQSGSDDVLRRMRRRWGSQRYIDRCRLLRDTLAQPALTTDIIVGFPGETEADFAATCRVAREVGFSKIHIFPFSARRGTPAAEMPNPIGPEAKAERASRLGEVEQELRERYYRELLGRRLRVLVEGAAKTPGRWLGTSCRYATVELAGNDSLVGEFADVRAAEIADNYIIGSDTFSSRVIGSAAAGPQSPGAHCGEQSL